MKTETLTTKEELDNLKSALTLAGLSETSIPYYIEWVKSCTPMKQEKAYIIKGETMNRVYKLKGDKAYPNHLLLVAIKSEDMEDPTEVEFLRFIIGARWFDDIVADNRPPTVAIDFNGNTETLVEQIDIMEDILISKTIEERDKEDDKVRYSFDDIKALAQKRLDK